MHSNGLKFRAIRYLGFSIAVNCLKAFAFGMVFLPFSLAMAAPVKVFILSGQSNIIGFGKVSEMGMDKKRYPDIRLYYALDNAPTLKFSPILTPGQTALDSTLFGPEFGIAEKLTTFFPGEKMAFIKVAWGGTGLKAHWLNAAAPEKVYPWFIAKVKSALEQLAALPEGYEIWGIIWMQGESDACSPDASDPEVYSANLKTLIESKMRPDLAGYTVRRQDGHLPFTYGQIRRSWPYGARVIEAQYRAQMRIPVVRCVSAPSTAGVYEVEEPNTGFSPAHYNTQGTMIVGKALGEGMVELLLGRKDLGCEAPADTTVTPAIRKEAPHGDSAKGR